MPTVHVDTLTLNDREYLYLHFGVRNGGYTLLKIIRVKPFALTRAVRMLLGIKIIR